MKPNAHGSHERWIRRREERVKWMWEGRWPSTFANMLYANCRDIRFSLERAVTAMMDNSDGPAQLYAHKKIENDFIMNSID